MIHTAYGKMEWAALRVLARKAAATGTVELRLRNLEVGPDGAVTAFEVHWEESVAHNEYDKVCAWGPCSLPFKALTPNGKYHDDNCRLKAFRAAKRAELQGQLDDVVANSRIVQHGVEVVEGS